MKENKKTFYADSNKGNVINNNLYTQIHGIGIKV